MKKNIYTGIFCTILGLCINTPANASLISRNFLDQALTDYATTTALDLKADKADLTDLSNKIGTLPSGETVANMLSWQEGIGLPLSDKYTNLLFNTHENSKNPKTVKEAIQTLFQCNSSPSSTGPCLPVMATNIFFGKTLSDEILNSLDFKINFPGLTEYKGLLQLTADIGTLPSGSLIGNSPAMDALFIYTQNTDAPVFPGSLSDLINQLYGNTEGEPGAITALLKGFNFEGFNDEYDGLVGIMPAMNLGLSAIQIAKTASATATAAKTAADANTAKIGTLPNEYETVGAALSAIKGIAEEAKAAALAAIPDPKTEGSNGKYVLTVDILEGDATYRWEQIDRGDTTSTTE